MANGKYSRLGTVTNMLHNLKRKFNKAESIGFKKGIDVAEGLVKEEFNNLTFLQRLSIAFFKYE